MKNEILILVLIGFLISCSNKGEIKESFEINGRFTHLITGCNNGENPEINCIEFIEFMDNSTADVLIGGGDIVFRTNYTKNNDKIDLGQMDGLNFKISFYVQNETTLNRIEDGGIWRKTQ